MSTTNGVTGNTGANITNLTGQNAALSKVDFNTFLQLLVTQLKNQDPLNPLDGTQFTGQIAQFSQLEQQINSNGYLQDILKERDYGQQQLAASYIGKGVMVPGNTIAKTDAGAEFGYSLDKAAANVTITIYDNATGQAVRTVTGDTEAGDHIVTWDGNDDGGDPVDNGAFTVKVKATDKDGKVVASTVDTYGTVASVVNQDGTSSLYLNDGRTATLDQVLIVTE